MTEAHDSANPSKRVRPSDPWRGNESKLLSPVFVQPSDDFESFSNSYNGDAYMESTCHDVIFIKHPFKCCQINNFFRDNAYIGELECEVKKLEMHIKSNDLYCFRQSGDLNTCCSDNFPAIQFFINCLSMHVKPALQRITGLELNDSISISASCYDYGDFLLCHDDHIDKKLHGRKIAFIYYLTPAEWHANDGGTLDLFGTDPETLFPDQIKRRLSPTRNSFSFFEVKFESHHQVSEIQRLSGGRLSIHGWFNGPITPHTENGNMKQHENASIVNAIVKSPGDIDEEEFLGWMAPTYLQNTTIMHIQRHFARQRKRQANMSFSEIFNVETVSSCVAELNNFANGDKLRSFIRKGPANRRQCHVISPKVGEIESRSCMLDKFLFFLTSDAFCVLLSQMTGLSWLDVSGANGGDHCPHVGCSKLEVRMWEAGNYSLLRDNDETLGPGEVAVHYFLMSDPTMAVLTKAESHINLSLDADPGSIIYAEFGKKEPVVIIEPKHNTLAVVVPSSTLNSKNNGLVCFNRYMNRTIFDSQRYYEIYLVFSKNAVASVAEN